MGCRRKAARETRHFAREKLSQVPQGAIPKKRPAPPPLPTAAEKAAAEQAASGQAPVASPRLTAPAPRASLSGVCDELWRGTVASPQGPQAAASSTDCLPALPALVPPRVQAAPSPKPQPAQPAAAAPAPQQQARPVGASWRRASSAYAGHSSSRFVELNGLYTQAEFVERLRAVPGVLEVWLLPEKPGSGHYFQQNVGVRTLLLDLLRPSKYYTVELTTHGHRKGTQTCTAMHKDPPPVECLKQDVWRVLLGAKWGP